ncbi:MAG: Bug family tripartite tricarboxylate transporter substrate binding protein [Burkholderiales bacterium]
MPGYIAAFFIVVVIATTSAVAQPYPAKPLRLLSTLSGGTEGLVRQVVQKAGDAFGQPVIMESQPGANGMIAAEMTARAAPDGYTILVAVPGSIVVRGFLTTVMPYQPVKDFTAITQAASAIAMIVAHPAYGANSLKEMLDKSKSGARITYGTNGIGSADHLTAELLNQLTGSRLVHVPHKTAVQAVTNAVSGEVDTYFGVYVSSAAMLKAGKLKPFAYTNVRPSAGAIPEVPLINEVLPGFQSPPYWVGFFGPARMPDAILRRLNGELVKALDPPEVRARWADLGFQVAANSSQEFTDILYADLERVARIVKGAGIKPE